MKYEDNAVAFPYTNDSQLVLIANYQCHIKGLSHDNFRIFSKIYMPTVYYLQTCTVHENVSGTITSLLLQKSAGGHWFERYKKKKKNHLLHHFCLL